MKINWEEVPTVNISAKGNENKLYLDHLPKGGKFLLPDKINWKESIGMTFYTLYEGEEYEIIIEDYNSKGSKLTLNVVGFYKTNYKMTVSQVRDCKFRKLTRNIYGNPRNVNRELIIEAVGEEKAKTLSPHSDLEVSLTCPDCGEKQKIHLINLEVDRLFKCQTCSDGYSYPEKLTKKLLDRLGINYITQFSYEKTKERKRYDFYLCDFEAILELHGRQHYEQQNRVGARTLEEEQLNDRAKREFALSKGIKEENYHEVDCRESTLKYCKPNLIKALEQYVDISLSDEEWKKLELDSQRSNFLEVIELYNRKGGTAKSISDEYGLAHGTIHTYLKKGHDLGLCIYNGKENADNLQSIPLVGINIETGVIKEFKSYKHVKQELGIKSDGIRKCIRGERESCKGYKWYLKENYKAQ